MVRKTAVLKFSIGRNAFAKRTKNVLMSWKGFCEFMQDTEDRPSFDGSEDKAEYKARKNEQQYIWARRIEGETRGDAGVESRSICWLDLDAVTPVKVALVKSKLKRLGLKYLMHTTTGDRHPLKGEDTRSVRVAVPTDRPMTADEIYTVNSTLAELVVGFANSDRTAFERARLMFAPHRESQFTIGEGAYLAVDDMLAEEFTPPREFAIDELSDVEAGSIDENNQALESWAFDTGLEFSHSGRGYIVTCPNSGAHSDDTDGTTATLILKPDNRHPEMRFKCMHDHCHSLNRHQHLAMRALGVPEGVLPEAHNISKEQIAEAIDFLGQDAIDELYVGCNASADGFTDGECSDADLMDSPKLTKHDPIIEGLLNFGSTWYQAGESNIGKSFDILGKMALVAMGRNFAGQKVIPAHCYYIDAEAPQESQRRKVALEMQYNAGKPIPNLHIIDAAEFGIDLLNAKSLNRLIRHIDKTSKNELVGIICFDSMNATMSLSQQPFNENDSGDMGRVVTGLKHIATATGGSPGVIHHPAKGSKTARGSGALHAAVDAAFFIEQPDPDKPGQINFYHEKARFGLKQSPRGFLLLPCKVPVDLKHSENIEQLQQMGEAWAVPDGFEEHKFSTTPTDETLYLVPVALKPFGNEAYSKVKKAPGTSGSKEFRNKWFGVLHTALSTLDEFPEGIDKSVILNAYKKNGGDTKRFSEQAFKTAIDSGTLVDIGDGNYWFNEWECCTQTLSDVEELNVNDKDLQD